MTANREAFAPSAGPAARAKTARASVSMAGPLCQNPQVTHAANADSFRFVMFRGRHGGWNASTHRDTIARFHSPGAGGVSPLRPSQGADAPAPGAAKNGLSIQQHVVPTGRAAAELRQIDEEVRVQLHAVRSD